MEDVVAVEVELDDGQQRYFEALMRLARRPIPHGDQYATWCKDRASATERGEEIAYCGNPNQIEA